jgi:hypothetical protein
MGQKLLAGAISSVGSSFKRKQAGEIQ